VDEGISYTYWYTMLDLDGYSFGDAAEKTVIHEFKWDTDGATKVVYLQGIASASRYFSLAPLDTCEVCLSSSIAQKFGAGPGDELVLRDDLLDREYRVVVKEVIAYDFGQYLFTSEEVYRQIFDLDETPWNALMSDEPLAVSSDDVLSQMSKVGIAQSANALLLMIEVMALIMIVVATAVLFIVTYLLMSTVISKSRTGISMAKVFGYRPWELNTMYLSGTIVFVLVGFVVSLPLSAFVCERFYAMILIDMQQNIAMYISPLSAVISFAVLVASYAGTMAIAKRLIARIDVAEVVKCRE
jgi:putative ABC transport system permease protein